MALIFDTETNGLPICKSYSEFPCYTDLSKYNSARLVQISYIITDRSFNKLEESDDIIKATDFKIENTQFHGITDEISNSKGIPFIEFAQKINNSLDFIDTIIENELLNELSIENSFYGKVKKFDTLHYISVYRNIDYDEEDEENYECNNCLLFNTYVKTQFTNICVNTIKQSILRFFRTM